MGMDKKSTPNIAPWLEEAQTAEILAIPIVAETKEPTKLFWQEEPNLFDQTSVVDLEVGWTGWKTVAGYRDQFYFRDFAYFDEKIEAGAYKDEEEALQAAARVMYQCGSFRTGGTDGDSLENTCIRIFAVTWAELLDYEGDALCEVLDRCWQQGNADSKHKVKKALYEKASRDKSIEAQLVILRQSGEFEPEQAKVKGSLTLHFDSEDAKA